MKYVCTASSKIDAETRATSTMRFPIFPSLGSRPATTHATGQAKIISVLEPGRHSYAREPDWGQRWSNERTPKTYITKALAEGQARSFEETLSVQEAQGEFMFLSLRQIDGFAPARFAERFGISLPEAFPQVAVLVAQGLLEEVSGKLRLTRNGLLVADSVFAEFF